MASDKQQLPQANTLVKKGCCVPGVLCTLPHIHELAMGRRVPPQEYKAERVEGQACILREIQPSCDPALALSKAK